MGLAYYFFMKLIVGSSELSAPGYSGDTMLDFWHVKHMSEYNSTFAYSLCLVYWNFPKKTDL